MGLSPTTRVSRKHETIFQPWDGDTEGLPYLGTGVSGAVFAIDEDRVVKIDVGTQRSIDDIESERLAYRSFVVAGGHRNVLRCFELEHEDGIVFQRCQETLRTRIRSKYQCGAPRIRTLKWALQAAKGLAFVHGCGVIQADVGCHNMLFSQRDTLKLADFAGSSVNGSEPTVNYEPRSRLPGRKPSVQTDIFALGCAVYEMTTGRPPYAEKSTMEVQALYKKQQYPELDCLPKLERIIRLCWMQKYGNVLSIVADLKELLAHEKQLASPSSSASDFSSATTCVSTVSNRSKKSTSSPKSIRVSTPIPMSKSGASLHAHFPDDPVITANASTVSKSLRRPHHDRKTSSGSIPQSQVRPHRRRKTSHDGISSTVGYTEKEKERLVGNGVGATTAGNGNRVGAGAGTGAGAAGKRNVLVKSGLTKSALVRNNAWVREKEREKDNEAKKSSFVGWFKWPHSKGISTCN